MRNVLESGNCIMTSVSFPEKHVKHITEQGKVMAAGNRTGCLRGKGGVRGGAAKQGQGSSRRAQGCKVVTGNLAIS